MASNLRRSKRTVGKRVNELNRRVSRLQKRPAPKRLSKSAVTTTAIAQNAVTNAEIAPGSVSSTELTSAVTSSITTAQATADGKNTIFYSTSAPTAVATGDLWFDTDNDHALSRWNGSAWAPFGLGNAAIANLDAGKITAGTISSARITSDSISAANINADRITAGTINGITLQTSDPDLSNGIKITSTGYIQGRGGSGVRIMNSDNSTGSTQLFKDVIFTGRFDGAEFLTSDGTSSHRIVPTFSEFKRFTDNASPVLTVYRRAWITGAPPGDGTADQAEFITFRREDNTLVGRIRYTAGADPTTIAYNTSSDARLKVELPSTIDPLEVVNQLQPKCFRWIDHEEGRVSYGLYAQEAYEVLPSHAFVGDSAESATLNEETGKHQVEDPWMIDYPGMVPYLIGAIKELSKKVDELESKIQ